MLSVSPIRFFTILTFLSAFLFNPLNLPSAQAAIYIFYIDQFGADSGNCRNQEAPCLTFEYAFEQLDDLAPGNFDIVSFRVSNGTFNVPSREWQPNYTLTIRGHSRETTILQASGSHPTLEIYLSPLRTFTLRDLTIQNGQAADGDFGGGLKLIGSGSNLTYITDVRFQNNHAMGGGGLFLYQVAALMTDSQVTSNTAENFGAGLAVEFARLTIVDSEISHNSITTPDQAFGGGLASLHADLTLNRAFLHNNTLTGQAVFGGGIFIIGDDFETTINNSVIANNHLIGTEFIASGAGIFCDTFSISDPTRTAAPSDYGFVTITNTTLSNNRITDTDSLELGASGIAFTAQGGCESVLTHNTFAFNQFMSEGTPPTYDVSTLYIDAYAEFYNNLIGSSINAQNCTLSIDSYAYTNLSDDDTCTDFNTYNGSLGIGPLSNVQSYAWPLNPLWPDSPALHYAFDDCSTTDARGFTRPSPCSLGAFEGFHYPNFLPIISR